MIDTHILIVRHGQSEWNAAGRWQGQADPPLTELGVAQAKAGAEVLAGTNVAFHDFVSSTLKRAHTTALALADELDIGAPVLDPQLVERDAGDWSGLTKPEIEAQYPGYLKNRQRPPGYESDEAMLPRLHAALERSVMRARQAATVAEDVIARSLVVAHGGIVYALEQSLGAPFERLGNVQARWFTHDYATGALALGDRIDLLAGQTVAATVPDQI